MTPFRALAHRYSHRKHTSVLLSKKRDIRNILTKVMKRWSLLIFGVGLDEKMNKKEETSVGFHICEDTDE